MFVLEGTWKVLGSPSDSLAHWGWLLGNTQQQWVKRHLKLLLALHFYPQIGLSGGTKSWE